MTSHSRNQVANANNTQIHNSKAKRRSVRHSALGGLEALETRNLLAANVMARQFTENNVSVLAVEGTSNPDNIYIEYSTNTGIFYVGTKFDGEDVGTFRGVQEIRVNGGAGNDRIDLHSNDGRNPPKVRAILTGGEGDDTLIGGSGDDWIDGGNGNDRIFGGAGADLLAGQGGSDTINGGSGNDVIYGGGGGSNPESGGADVDYLYGDDGDDSIWGGGGNDELRGGNGKDTLCGGSGNDMLMGGADYDQLFGGSGLDSLYGEFSTTSSGKTENNWLEAGAYNDSNAKNETAIDGWNAHKPVVDGIKFTDIDQESMNSCTFMSSLAGAAKLGAITSDSIQYQGNFKYTVRFYDPAGRNDKAVPIYADAYFDGNTVEHKGSRMDPECAANEFWTLLYQRAYYKKFYGIGQNDAKSLAAFSGPHNSDFAMLRLMKQRIEVVNKGTSGFTAAQLKSHLDEGWPVTTTLKLYKVETTNAGTSVLESSNHSYLVNRVYTSSTGDTMVELYNPYHSMRLHADGLKADGTKISFTKGSSDGLVSIKWSDYYSAATYFAW